MLSFSHIGGLKSAVSAIALTALVSGCVTPGAGADGRYATPIGDAPVTTNPTAYSQALVCIGEAARTRGVVGPRVAVGRILDYTGKVDPEGGRRITQGASLMAITAFAKAGARLLERFDTSVSELELRYANNKLIADAPETPRPILAGQVPGSDFYLVGGITELNYNIRSGGVDAAIGDIDPRDLKGTFTGKLFVMNIGLDLRLVSTQTLEVVDVVSYQKQIVGREVSAGIFNFWDDTLFDIGAGERAMEPIQMAVRAGVERAVVEMMSNLYGIETSEVCQAALAAGGDPMGSASTAGNFRANTPPAAQAARRDDINAWHDRRDTAIRGRLQPEANEERVAETAPSAPMQPTTRLVDQNATARSTVTTATTATATEAAKGPAPLLVQNKPATSVR